MNKITQFINNVIRPCVQADGGEVVVANANEHELALVLMGECAVCPSNCGVREWITEQVHAKFGPGIRVSFDVKKRYFQDKQER